jgi:hypothetical protein
MPFSEFYANLGNALEKFDLTNLEEAGIFGDRPLATPSTHISETLQYNVRLASAIGNEKARSELIVAPMLLELTRVHRPNVSFFSGVDLSVDPAEGLNGTCDFLISASREQLFVKAPIVIVVEAKKESIVDGMGQCVAEMVASRIFNERKGNGIETVYGAVTTGTTWQFLSLTGRAVQIDMNEYHIDQPGRILGILVSMVPDTK